LRRATPARPASGRLRRVIGDKPKLAAGPPHRRLRAPALRG